MKSNWATIKGISCHLPLQKLTNEQLALEFQDWSIDKIYQKTGIAERRVAGPDECASDLGVAAAEKLFATGICNPHDIDFLLFCTQTPDYFLPASACVIQDRLGLPLTCGALDYNLGCSGFVYGLALAKGLVENGLCRNVLLINADTYTKLIHPKDRSVRTLFGDGAAATLISGESDVEAIGPFVFGTDGRGSHNLIVPAGGFRLRLGPETAIEKEDGSVNIRSAQNLYMNGPEILNFTIKVVPQVVTQLLSKCQLRLEDVDYFIFHQANRLILDMLRKKIKIPEKKFCVDLEFTGNTVSSSIPIALENALKNHIVNKGDRLMLLGFGVGYSWVGGLIKII